MNIIKELISQKKWVTFTTEHSTKEICLALNFSEAMHLVEHLAYDDIQNSDYQQFALKLILEIKDYFKEDWQNDWKNDVFLGDLCCFICLYDERYFFYKQAYDRLVDPPAALLLRLAGCSSAPGKPPITDEESEYYLKKSAEKIVTLETALSLRTLYQKKGDLVQSQYWDKIYQKLEKENIHADFLVPDIPQE